MKKILLPLFCLLSLQSEAKTWTVNVQNYQFSPATLNVMVGDVIHWVLIDGTHTTSSVSVPSGANAWDSPMDITNTTFDYTVTQAGSYSYQCNFHASLGMVGSFTASGALPVDLSSFSLRTQNNMPLLLWTTETELNTDYFSIRRSTNGINFEEIGKVAATGNSSTEKKYSFLDDKIPTGINYVYYALATVDNDGKSQLSSIIVYKNEAASPKLIISLSPNPVSSMGHLMLQFNADKPGVMIATLIDIQGKVVLKTELSAEVGINNGHIHLGDVPPGTYVIKFSLNGVNESYKIVKN